MVRRGLLPPWLLHHVSGNRTAGRGFPEIKVLRERKITKWEAPSAVEPRLGACRSRAPSPHVPMVFLMRNYVRVARILPFGWDWGGATLLCELGTCQAVLLPITLGALEGVRVFNHRTGGLP